jgi:Acetyltransferase (GNAT) domain
MARSAPPSCDFFRLGLLADRLRPLRRRARVWERKCLRVEIEIQVLIARKFWSKGFGREAVSELIRAAFELQEVTSVVAVVDPENTKSRRLMDNLGFECVGRKCSQNWDSVANKYLHGWDHQHMIFRLARANGHWPYLFLVV